MLWETRYRSWNLEFWAMRYLRKNGWFNWLKKFWLGRIREYNRAHGIKKLFLKLLFFNIWMYLVVSEWMCFPPASLFGLACDLIYSSYICQCIIYVQTPLHVQFRTFCHVRIQKISMIAPKNYYVSFGQKDRKAFQWHFSVSILLY